VKVAEKALGEAEAKLRAARDAHAEELRAELNAASEKLAAKAESIVARANERVRALESEVAAKDAALEANKKIVADVVAACKQEEAGREEAQLEAARANARARAAEESLERSREETERAEDARRDAEAKAEKSARKAARYRDENASLVANVDRTMRRLAAAATPGGLASPGSATLVSALPQLTLLERVDMGDFGEGKASR
jgi:colicin import membrane protein